MLMAIPAYQSNGPASQMNHSGSSCGLEKIRNAPAPTMSKPAVNNL
jgi:hypothetical protein